VKSNEYKGAPLLEVRNLSISFTRYEGLWRQRKQCLVRDLSLEVKEGEMVAVVGSSGSGKSLLAHGVMGLLPYNASWDGEIYYKGELLTEKRLRKLRGREMVFVPQSVSYLDPLMRVGEQVRKGARSEKSREQCQQVLKRYGLGKETETLYPFELSGGMTRRILIATAVQEHPGLVIADEPTPGLHLEAAKRVLSHFREIADDGAGVLLITHDLELAVQVADRIVVFYAGTNLEEAWAADFTDEKKLRHPYTKALYRAMPQNGFKAVSGFQPYEKEFGEGCVFAPRCEACEARCHEPVYCRKLRGGMVRCWKGEEEGDVCEIREKGRGQGGDLWEKGEDNETKMNQARVDNFLI
jgi:peptide/nickel transport system ATP-binding protein